MSGLVLSLFPGIGLLDMAFEQEGFCVVRGPDVLWGGDIKRFHPPAGKFDGVIGGPPCQEFSLLANMVRQNGYEPKFGNLIPEFERVVSETKPAWFVMENVPRAPVPSIDGFDVYSYILNNRQCIDESGMAAVQNRVRRFSWGWRGTNRPPLLIDVCLWQNPEYEYAACGGSSGSSLGAAGWDGGKDKQTTRRNPGVVVKIGGSGKVKSTLNKCVGNNIKGESSLARLCRLQGLPEDYLKHSPFTIAAKCKAVGNGVPLPMGRAIAKAVAEAVSPPHPPAR